MFYALGFGTTLSWRCSGTTLLCIVFWEPISWLIVIFAQALAQYVGAQAPYASDDDINYLDILAPASTTDRDDLPRKSVFDSYSSLEMTLHNNDSLCRWCRYCTELLSYPYVVSLSRSVYIQVKVQGLCCNLANLPYEKLYFKSQCPICWSSNQAWWMKVLFLSTRKITKT